MTIIDGLLSDHLTPFGKFGVVSILFLPTILMVWFFLETFLYTFFLKHLASIVYGRKIRKYNQIPHLGFAWTGVYIIFWTSACARDKFWKKNFGDLPRSAVPMWMRWSFATGYWAHQGVLVAYALVIVTLAVFFGADYFFDVNVFQTSFDRNDPDCAPYCVKNARKY